MAFKLLKLVIITLIQPKITLIPSLLHKWKKCLRKLQAQWLFLCKLSNMDTKGQAFLKKQELFKIWASVTWRPCTHPQGCFHVNNIEVELCISRKWYFNHKLPNGSSSIWLNEIWRCLFFPKWEILGRILSGRK